MNPSKIIAAMAPTGTRQNQSWDPSRLNIIPTKKASATAKVQIYPFCH